jgi:hypothetical protein
MILGVSLRTKPTKPTTLQAPLHGYRMRRKAEIWYYGSPSTNCPCRIGYDTLITVLDLASQLI